MAYTRNWDESAPLGSVNASTIDTIIQQLKTDLRERLDDVIPAWSTDSVDPKRVKIHTGTSRPSSNLGTGELFFNTSSGAFEVYNGSAWVGLNAIALNGTLSNRPSASTTPAGSLYWATDNSTLYINISSAWVSTKPASASFKLLEAEGTLSFVMTASTQDIETATEDLSSQIDDDFENYYIAFARVRFRENTAPGDWTVWFYPFTAPGDDDTGSNGVLYEDFEGVGSTVFPLAFYLKMQTNNAGLQAVLNVSCTDETGSGSSESVDYQIQVLIGAHNLTIDADPAFVG